MKTPETTTEYFNQYRLLLFSIAYRMLGSATDAEDIVQEAFVRWLQAADDAVQSPKAYLSTIVVHLCLDQLRSAQAKREVYVGNWLPEPLLTEQQSALIETPILAESLSFAFLVMLENLGPLERAVFLLREVFEYEYSEIAAMIDKSEANCRQILRRAHQHLDQRRARFDASPQQQEQLVTQFLQASVNDDMQGLLTLLTEDAVFTADSGGKRPAGRLPVHGRDKVARGMLGGQRWLPTDIQIRFVEVNGQRALLILQDEQPYGVVLFSFEQGRISQIYWVVNPDKLRWIK